MPDYLRRAIRTFIQSFCGAIISSGVLSAAATAGVVDWSVVTKILIAALAGGVTGLLTLGMNALEDNGSIPAVLKAPASEGVNPVPPDAGGAA